MRLAIVTKFASTKSGAKVPFDLAFHFVKKMHVSIFAEKYHVQEKLSKTLAKNKIDLILYSNPFDFYQKLKKAKCQLISSHTTFPYFLALKLTRIPVVKTYHGTQFDAYLEKFPPGSKISSANRLVNNLVNIFLWLDQKIQLALSDCVVAISKACQKELKDLFKTKSKLIYNGISLPDSPPVSLNTKAENTPITILSVSRITPYKGFHLLIDCIQQIRREGYNIKLQIAGSSGKKSYLSYLKKKLEKKDQIFINLNEKALSNLIINCDIYATCDRYLFFGLPVAEAAAAAKPSVALDFFAAKELILNGKTGYIAKNMDEFYKYLKILIKNPRRQKRFGEEAYTHARRNFDIVKTSQAYLSIFKKFLK